MERRARAGAFTLIEVLLALALLAGVTGAALGLLGNLTRRQEQVRWRHDQALDGGLLVDRLESALTTSYAVDAQGGAGVSGDDHSIRVWSRGVVGHAGVVSGDRRMFEAHWSSERRELEVRFEADGVDGSGEVLASPVERVRFRYFHGARWRSSFDSARSGELPSAVEVAVWFARPGPEVAVEAGAPDDLDALLDEAALAMDASGAPTRAPDRLRVMVIPDAPGASWGVSE